MKLTLHVWRQDGARDTGRFERYEATEVSEHMSFLEMLDVVNERLTEEGNEPIAFARSAGAFALSAGDHRLGAGRGVSHGRSDEDEVDLACRTGPGPSPRRVSCICGPSKTATRSGSSPGGPPRSR